MRISLEVQSNRSLFYGALAQMIYATIEFVDSLCIPLIALGFIPNWYLMFPIANPAIANLLETEPLWFVPFFWFFTAFRIASGIWILQNKVKGFWMAMWISVITIFAAMFLLPFGVFDIACTGIVVFLLFMGYFKDEPLVRNRNS
jgi:hypothetical protein